MQFLKGTTLLDRSFQTSITLKGIDGLLEIIGAILVLVANQARVNSFVDVITRHSLARNPNAFIATHLLHASQGIVGHARYFLFFYLVSHGLTKVVLVAALWLNRMWAYPAMILLLISFIVYQLYRMTFAPSWFLVLLTLFDAVVIWLTWAEYEKQRALKMQKVGDPSTR